MNPLPSGVETVFWTTGQGQTLLWSLGLILLYPLLMIGLGESILRLRDRPILQGGLRAIRNLVMPTLAVFILLSQIMQLDAGRTPLRLALTVLWISLIHVTLLFAKGLLFARHPLKEGRVQVPRLLRDLVQFVLVAIGAAIVLSSVWGADLGGIIAALGVGSIVLGLALQDALGNLFSGLALLIEQPFAVGDWIQVGSEKGRIIEINWRAVHLVTRERELVIVPNSILAGEIVHNFQRPETLHVETIDLGFSYDDPPNVIKQVLKETALATSGVLPEPPPIIQTVGYNDSAIDYRVRLCLADYGQVPQIRDDFMSRVWYAAQRNRLTIPFPIRTVYHQPVAEPNPMEQLAQRVAKLRSQALFLSLSTDALEALAHSADLRQFGRGERVLQRGATQVQLHLLIRGRVQISAPNGAGAEVAIAQLDQGDFFGESALLPRQASTANVTAIDDVEVLLLNTTTLQQVLTSNPSVLAHLDQVIDQRRGSGSHKTSPPSTPRHALSSMFWESPSSSPQS